MSSLIAPGTEIEGFIVGERVHAGAMGDVYQVTHPEHALPMVMKLPRFGTGDSVENLLGFETESMILPELSGPHVARFIAAGDLTRRPFLVLEYLRGESLETRLQRGRMDASEVAPLGAAIADALHSVHRQEIVHLDLKPDNAIVRPDGTVALIDFGLSHHTRFPDLLAEEKRYAAGSAPYVSPEQVQGCRSDSRSDLFALGVVLFELVTGELPFGIPGTIAGLRDRLWRDPQPPRSIVPDVPPWLQEIILRCLEVDPSVRYQSAAHVAFDLRNPAQVNLTGRAEKATAAGFLAQAGRWWRARERGPATRRRDRATLNNAPVIMVAVDTTNPDEARLAAVQRATQQVLTISNEFRLVCVSVLGGFEKPTTPTEAGQDPDLHLEHLVRLRHWADPMKLPPHRLSLHVIEALSASSALLDFARRNHADLIILGAPDPGRGLTWIRSAASRIAAGAPCSVHLVRTPAHRTAAEPESDEIFSEDDLP